jgi:hypothetical protein
VNIFADAIDAIGRFFSNVWHAITDLFSSSPPAQTIKPCPLSHPMSPEKAQEYFDKFKNDPNIPFDYPIDCCYTRAETMTDQIAADGYSCGKVWNYGSGFPNASLTYFSDKVPGGVGHWRYHVAPIVPVTQPDGSVKMMVIDPSTQSGPVTIEKWRADQHDPGAPPPVETDSGPYYLAPDGKVLPETAEDNVALTLAKHRARRDMLKASMTPPAAP